VADSLLLSAINPVANGKVYNLGADPINLLDLARLMIEVNGSGQYKLVPFPEDRKRIDIGDYFGNYSRIQNELGWQPKIPLKQGLKKTFEFYRKRLADYL
jgi:nucleoside-diphosphate-sugar epimerase